jgi:hypothetical protein
MKVKTKVYWGVHEKSKPLSVVQIANPVNARWTVPLISLHDLRYKCKSAKNFYPVLPSRTLF